MQRNKNGQRLLPGKTWNCDWTLSATVMRLLNYNAIQHAMYHSEPPVAKGTMDNTLGKTHVEPKAHPTHHPSHMREHHAMWAWVNGNALSVILNQWQCESESMPNISQITTNLEAMCQTSRKSLQIWKPCAKHIANHYKSGSRMPNISQITTNLEAMCQIYRKTHGNLPKTPNT